MEVQRSRFGTEIDTQLLTTNGQRRCDDPGNNVFHRHRKENNRLR